MPQLSFRLATKLIYMVALYRMAHHPPTAVSCRSVHLTKALPLAGVFCPRNISLNYQSRTCGCDERKLYGRAKHFRDHLTEKGNQTIKRFAKTNKTGKTMEINFAVLRFNAI
jgi:hypothetical protein